jgi:hypothetical protein
MASLDVVGTPEDQVQVQVQVHTPAASHIIARARTCTSRHLKLDTLGFGKSPGRNMGVTMCDG